MQKSNPAKSVTLLGKSEMGLPKSPAEAVLEAFPNPNPKVNYLVRFGCEEFTSLCPVTGQPDFGSIEIEYRPAKACIESKSLKFYLASFRNEKSFCEAVVNRILGDFVQACSPRWARVTGVFASRGGIQLTIEAEHGKGSKA
jgi:7-cyano-7-deazaguanine reductase